MKTLLGIVVISLTLFLGGCSTTTPPQQGQPGAQGQTGQSGQPGDQGQAGQPGQTGQTGQPGDQGQPGQTGQTGQQGKAAPCPAGQHRYTDPNTGTVRCVSD